MNWDALGALAEAAAAVAVLATLVYLSWQLRNYREEQQRTIQAYRQTVLRDFMMESVRNPVLSEGIREARDYLNVEYPDGVIALQEKCGLDAEKATVLNAYYLAQFLHRVETVQNLSLLSEEQRKNFEGQIIQNYVLPGPEQVWFTQFRKRGVEMPIFELLDGLIEERSNDEV